MIAELEVKTTLLQPLETSVAPASAGPMRVGDCFKRNTGILFSMLFAEFKNRFLDKTEPGGAQIAYRRYKLMCIAPDGPIIAELGGSQKIEGTFGAAFAFLQQQPKGEAGFLQTNGYANIFYAKDKNNELCAILVRWTNEGWVLDAMPVEDPQAWHGEHLIFSPLR